MCLCFLPDYYLVYRTILLGLCTAIYTGAAEHDLERGSTDGTNGSLEGSALVQHPVLFSPVASDEQGRQSR